MKLLPRVIEKPWGRTDLPPSFGGPTSSPVGEVWFEHPDSQDLPLLVKYIFTSEKLSVQVHPNDDEARERGLQRGKNECWYILGAEPGATLGLGLKSQVSKDAVLTAALDGSIEDLMHWRQVYAGDFFYVPAGTIHAIGAGVTLLEVQQNSDVTYRLYDYGRPRELHLDDGMAVLMPGEYDLSRARRADGPTDVVLLNQSHFSLIRASSPGNIPAAMTERRRWVMPLQGRAASQGAIATSGECLLLEPGAQLSLRDSAVCLVSCEGALTN